MMRHTRRLLLIVVLIMLLACLPALAARGGQGGLSSAVNDPGAVINVSSGLSAASTGTGGTVPATGTGRSVSSPSPVQALPGVTAPDTARVSPSAAGKNQPALPVNSPVGTAPSYGRSTDALSPAALSNGGPENAGGTTGSSQGTGAEHTAGMPGAAAGTGSPQTAGREKAASVPDARGPAGAPAGIAGVTGSPGGIAVARFASSGTVPGPEAGHGPSPQRHRQGPPAPAAGYPCGPAQAAPLPPAQGQARDESKDGSIPRPRSRRDGIISLLPDTVVPEPASSVPPQAPFPFSMLLFGGFRRISKKNVLDHDARQVIYQAISAAPGTDVRTLADMTGINEHTLRYHLDRLAETRMITSFARPGVVRYFQNQGAYSQFEHQIFHYLRTGATSGILRLLHRNPGLTRQDIADMLMITGPSVTRQMISLIGDGLVENRSPGRSNNYYLTAEAARAIGKVMSRVHPLHEETDARPMAVSAG